MGIVSVAGSILNWNWMCDPLLPAWDRADCDQYHVLGVDNKMSFKTMTEKIPDLDQRPFDWTAYAVKA